MPPVRRWLKHHGPVHLGIVLVFLLPLLWLLTVVPDGRAPVATKVRLWFDSLEYRTVDTRMYYGRKAVADPRIVLLAIDSPSIRLDALDDATIAASPALTALQPRTYPFRRDVYAFAADRLLGAGAKVVTLDILFQGETPHDVPLAGEIAAHPDKIVLGLNFTSDSSSYDIPPASLLPGGDPLDPRLGYLNYWQDTDDEVRCAVFRNNLDYMNGHAGAERLPRLQSFAARILDEDGHAALVPDDFTPRPLRFARAGAFPTFSLYLIFDPHSWEKTFRNGDYFRDKLVVIGPAGDWSKDVFLTPAGVLPGAEIHLNALNALLHGEFLTPASNGQQIVAVLLVAVLALALAALVHSIGLRFCAALLLAILYAGGVMGVYNGPGWLLPVLAPTVLFVAAVGTGFVYDFIIAQLERYRLRLTFERYSSKNVVKHLLANPASYQEMLVGVRRDVSVLFSDIRSFTTIVEMAPDSRALVSKLNEYLTAMVDCVLQQDGNLEKFMGDGIMAVWGNTPYSLGAKDDAVRAVRAALAMTRALRQLNEKWRAEGSDAWRIGIGVNHGSVIVGDMGSPDHKEFAMVGDPVNLGSRLEGLTKEYHVEIMIGEMAADLTRDVFYLRSVDLVRVKGKHKAVKAYTVLGERKDGLPPEREEFLRLHEEGWAAFRGRDFVRARALFGSALELEPNDYIAREFFHYAMRYMEEPPPADWDGVRVMKDK
jgi:adenylate cyclase